MQVEQRGHSEPALSPAHKEMETGGDLFKLHSEYQPTGDQPQAIEALVKGFKEGNQFQTLLGVTGSGNISLRMQWSILSPNLGTG